MREQLRFFMVFGLLASAAGCQPSAAGPDPVSDESKLKADNAPQQCGATTCAAGSVCCNASCGICTPPGQVCIQLACDPAHAGKSCADTRCDVGETCMETRGGAQCVAKEENPCNLLDCPPNAICKVVQGAALCEPIAPSADAGARADAGTKADAGPVVTGGGCLLALCAGTCREVPGGIVCEPWADAGIPVAASCAATLCPVGTDCDDLGGQARCIKAPSCDGTRCASGQHCELSPVQCIRAPCPAQPTCVADAKDVCATVRCAAGTHCAAKTVQCIRAPCPPVAECVPDASGTPCGKSTCGAGTYCCNASCGVCAPTNGACTQQICAANN